MAAGSPTEGPKQPTKSPQVSPSQSPLAAGETYPPAPVTQPPTKGGGSGDDCNDGFCWTGETCVDPDAFLPYDAECGCKESETCGGDRCYIKGKMKWKFTAFKFRAKWSLVQNKKCQWVFRFKLTIKRAIRRLFKGLFRRSRVVIKYICKLDSLGYKDPTSCFDPGSLTWSVNNHEAHPLAESVAGLNSLGAREGVYVVVGTGDYSEDWTKHSTDALISDLRLGEKGQGIMRDEKNPDDPDQLLIVDPITFEGGSVALDVPPMSAAEPTDPCLENCPEEDNDSTWLIPAIAGGASCCLLVAIVALYVRRKQQPRVQFSEFAARMGALDEEEPACKQTVQDGSYTNLKEDVEGADRSASQLSGIPDRSPRRVGSRPSARGEDVEMTGGPEPMGKSILEHGVV